MEKLFITLFAVTVATTCFAQVTKTEELSEVTVYATSYKYLNNVATEEVASLPVEMLERKVAAYDVKSSEYYQDDYDLYYITFFIPDGKILAAYDKDGKIFRTAERFKDVNLPKVVKKAVMDRFPGWKITNDIYLVYFHDSNDNTTKRYKLKLENGDKILRVKLDENGKFL